jgi:hypothetical protein
MEISVPTLLVWLPPEEVTVVKRKRHSWRIVSSVLFARFRYSI